jgi:CheY-like chemotaxis protein
MLLNEMGLTDNVWATNGREALTLLKRKPTDLIISGWSMPEMDSLDLLNACKEDPGLKKIPFIIMGSGEELRAKALEAGADAYIVKPFFSDDLQEVLEKLGAWPFP